MLWSGSRPQTVVRESMWGFLMFAGVAWLAISWSVLRLEPTDIVQVAGPVVLFGALTEGVRALAGTKTWWLNAGMAALFAATGGVLLTSTDSSFTTPAALIGWYLMVRGAADVAVSMMTRETDRIWGLLMVVGVLETGLGFFAASPLSRTADLLLTVLGGLALARGVADLVAALRLREVSAAGSEILQLPPERAAGVAGYSAGLTDVDGAPMRAGPRHRATPRALSGSAMGSASGMSELSAPAGSRTAGRMGSEGWSASGIGDRVAGAGAQPGGRADSVGWTPSESWTGTEGRVAGSASRAGSGSEADAGLSTFHDEVLRTTADLDAMLALAGVTGAGVAAGMAEHYEMPEIPDTAEGAEVRADTVETPVVPESGHGGDPMPGPKPSPDPVARETRTASPGSDDSSINAGGRLLD
jgi:uncharacterized membrane protein HdeD (DUF308 family)